MTNGDAITQAKNWIAAWNAHDLDAILLHYSPNVVFEARTVATRWNKVDGKFHGIGELRDHFALGLELAPNLHFELEQVFIAPSGYSVLYTRGNGNRVIDCVELDARWRANRVVAYCSHAQT
jgi:hypothetical protein